jgi:hypothetical protein
VAEEVAHFMADRKQREREREIKREKGSGDKIYFSKA